MKKVLLILMCLTISFLCVGCNLGGITFDSKEEMLTHLNGVWKCDYASESLESYCIISKEGIYFFNVDAFNQYAYKYFDNIVKEDFEKFQNASIQENLNVLYEQFMSESSKVYTVNYKKGKIIFNIQKEELTINKNGFILEDDYSDSKYQYKKISDVCSLSEKDFGEMYVDAKSYYKIPLESFLLSTDNCAEKLKEKHSEINSYILVSDDGSKIYTDNGNLSSSNSFLVSDGTVLFSKKNSLGQYLYLYDCENKSITVRDTSGIMNLKEIIEDALICVSKYPMALTVDDLLTKFENEAELKSGLYDLNIIENDISYRILKTTSQTDKEILVKITFK